MKRYHLILLLVAILLPSAAGAKAFNTDRTLWRKGQEASYRRLPTQRLLRMGEDFLYRRELSDSAFLCYTIVAERYRPEMAESDIAQCLEGYYGRWMCRFMNYSEIPSAMQDLSAAQEIIERTSLPRYKLDLYYGQCYLCITAANNFMIRAHKDAIKYFNTSCQTSLRLKDYKTFHSAFNNLVTSCLLYDSMQLMEPIVARLGTLREPQMWRRDVSLLWYNGAVARHDGHLGQAIRMYDSINTVLPHNLENARMRSAAFTQKIMLLLMQNRYDECLAVTDSLAKLSNRFRLPDIRMTVYRIRSLIGQRRGDTILAHEYDYRYLALKDSLSGVQQATDFQEINFSAQRRAMQRDLDASNYRNRLRGYVIGFSALVVALLVYFILRQRRINLRLRRRSEMLYRQLQSTIHSPTWIESSGDIQPDQSDQSDLSDLSDQSGTREKHASSGLTDEVTEKLAEKVREFMLNSESPYSTDFSLPTMAALLDTNRQYLSQCINRHFGCNFSTLVNRARIRRAMLLLDDEQHYGHYSIEGIAETVGFRSRDSFNLWFRRFTDLTAAEYRRLGKALRPRL